MSTEQATLLPLHDFLARLHAWQTDATDDRFADLETSFERITSAYGARGAILEADLAPLPRLELGTGSLAIGARRREDATTSFPLVVVGAPDARATLTLDSSTAAGVNELCQALELSLSALWAQHQSLAQQRQLDALDSAVRGIATITSVERVLQVIVDRVRELVRARYAALGIVGPFGQIEQFIVSGISDELRAKLGPPPRGHGLLGVIIREDRSLLIDDIAADPQRYGFPEHHPEMHSLLGVPVRSKGKTIGNLYVTEKETAPAFDRADMRLVERFALHAGIAIENARLHEEIGRLAIVDERQRISQELHDSVIQSLYGISLSLEDLPEVMTEDADEGAARADRAIESIHATIRDIRNFIMGLQPEILNGANLSTGIRTLASEFEANTLIDLELSLDGIVVDLPPNDAAHLLAVVREALSNIARHSRATRAVLQIAELPGNLTLVIQDNGRGFNVDSARTSAHHGLKNLQSRAQAIGASLAITSEPGAGTRIELTLPNPGSPHA